jgi:hypothetical protein
MVRGRAMVFKYIILYANVFDYSAIALVNVDVVFFSNFSYHRPPSLLSLVDRRSLMFSSLISAEAMAEVAL